MKEFLVVWIHLAVLIVTTKETKGQREYNHVSHNMDEDGYVFEYSVVDGDSTWVQSHGEWSDGISTHGSYNVKLPDGRIQKVIYTADEHGFRPVISYETPPGGYGWRNHISLEDVDSYGSEELAMKDRYGYGESDLEFEGYGDGQPPPHYQITKFHPMTHMPKHHTPYEYEPLKSNEDLSYHDKPSKIHASSYDPSVKKRIHAAYHTVEKYHHGPYVHAKYGPRIGKDSGEKYPMKKAKTYYMTDSEERAYLLDASKEESLGMKDRGMMHRDDTFYMKMGDGMKDHHEMMAPMNSEEGSHEEVNYMQKHGTNMLYRGELENKYMMDDEESYEESSEEEKGKYGSEEDSDDEESSEEGGEIYGSEESEEEEDGEEEERSSYVAMMTSMMPPTKPYVPPTYFALASSSSESSEETEQDTLPLPTMPPPATPPTKPEEEEISSGDGEMEKVSGEEEFAIHSTYPSTPIKLANINDIPSAVPTTIYSPLHPTPYRYHSPHYPYHHHHHISPYPIHVMSHYKPSAHYRPHYVHSDPHPYAHRQYQLSPNAYLHPLGNNNNDDTSSTYTAIPVEVPEGV